MAKLVLNTCLYGMIFIPGIIGCGVRGAPTPYVEAYPEKKEVPAVSVPAPSPTPEVKASPTPSPKARRPKKKQ